MKSSKVLGLWLWNQRFFWRPSPSTEHALTPRSSNHHTPSCSGCCDDGWNPSCAMFLVNSEPQLVQLCRDEVPKDECVMHRWPSFPILARLPREHPPESLLGAQSPHTPLGGSESGFSHDLYESPRGVVLPPCFSHDDNCRGSVGVRRVSASVCETDVAKEEWRLANSDSTGQD